MALWLQSNCDCAVIEGLISQMLRRQPAREGKKTQAQQQPVEGDQSRQANKNKGKEKVWLSCAVSTQLLTWSWSFGCGARRICSILLIGIPILPGFNYKAFFFSAQMICTCLKFEKETRFDTPLRAACPFQCSGCFHNWREKHGHRKGYNSSKRQFLNSKSETALPSRFNTGVVAALEDSRAKRGQQQYYKYTKAAQKSGQYIQFEITVVTVIKKIKAV